MINFKGLSFKVEPVLKDKDELSKGRPTYTVLESFMLLLLEGYQMPTW